MGIESLSAIEAILIAISGLLTVTLMLGCLSLLIMVISKIVTKLESKPEKTAVTAPTEELLLMAKDDSDIAYGGETLLVDVDEKTAACIMAIVSENTGIPLSQLVFKKIRAL